MPGESGLLLQRLDKFNDLHRVPASSSVRHLSTVSLLGLRLVLRTSGSEPLRADGGFAAVHQEDRDAFHQGGSGTVVRSVCTLGADADADADDGSVIHSGLRAREAAFFGHSYKKLPQG